MKRFCLPPTRHSTGFTLVELLVVIAIIGILVGMLFPAVQQVREASRRTACINNVRQLAVGCLNYETSNQLFPQGCQVGQGAAWSAYILNQLEQPALAKRVIVEDNSTAPGGSGNGSNWTAGTRPGNNESCGVFMSVFRCPSDPVPQHIDSGGVGQFIADRVPSSYIGVATGTVDDEDRTLYYRSATPGATIQEKREFMVDARNGVLVPNQQASYFGSFRLKTRVGFEDILDGSSNTLMLGESIFDTSDYNYVASTGTVTPIGRSIDHWYIGSPQVDGNGCGSGSEPCELSEFVGSTAIEINLYHRYSDRKLNELTSQTQVRDLFDQMEFGFGSWHAGDGAVFAFADGSAKLITSRVDPDTYKYLGNRMDRQTINDF